MGRHLKCDTSKLWVPSSANFNVDDVKTLNETVALLQEPWGLVALSASHNEIDTILVLYGWPIKVPEAFFAMVKEQRPEALIVSAHYSLLLNKVDRLWYMQTMSRRLLQTIFGKLGKEWESWIAWPLQNLIFLRSLGVRGIDLWFIDLFLSREIGVVSHFSDSISNDSKIMWTILGYTVTILY